MGQGEGSETGETRAEDFLSVVRSPLRTKHRAWSMGQIRDHSLYAFCLLPAFLKSAIRNPQSKSIIYPRQHIFSGCPPKDCPEHAPWCGLAEGKFMLTCTGTGMENSSTVSLVIRTLMVSVSSVMCLRSIIMLLPHIFIDLGSANLPVP